MKFLVLLSVAVACASAAVDEASAPVLRSSYDITPEGAFQYAYETGNGIYAQVEGQVKSVPGENEGIEIKGGYKYTAPDGTPVELTYVANEAGYQPAGSHLPVGPEVPDYIVRSLAYIAAHPPPVSSPQAYQPTSQYQPPKPQYG